MASNGNGQTVKKIGFCVNSFIDNDKGLFDLIFIRILHHLPISMENNDNAVYYTCLWRFTNKSFSFFVLPYEKHIRDKTIIIKKYYLAYLINC